MGWAAEVDAWAVALRAAGRASTTIGTRRDHVARLGRAMPCGPWDVTGPMLVEWAGGQEWARETSVAAGVVGSHVAASVRYEGVCRRPGMAAVA